MGSQWSLEPPFNMYYKVKIFQYCVERALMLTGLGYEVFSFFFPCSFFPQVPEERLFLFNLNTEPACLKSFRSFCCVQGYLYSIFHIFNFLLNFERLQLLLSIQNKQSLFTKSFHLVDLFYTGTDLGLALCSNLLRLHVASSVSSHPPNLIFHVFMSQLHRQPWKFFVYEDLQQSGYKLVMHLSFHLPQIW